MIDMESATKPRNVPTFAKIRSHWPLLLAHHPLCDAFAKDVVGHKHPVCRGCLFFYPVLLFSLLVGKCILVFDEYIHGHALRIFLFGILLVATFFISVVAPSTPRWVSDGIHLSTGIGTALLILSIFALPLPVWMQIFLLFEVQFLFAFASYRRIRKFDQICNHCEFHTLGHACPGFTQKSLKS